MPVPSTLTRRKSLESVKKAAFATLASFPPELISLIFEHLGEDFGRERQKFRLICRCWNYLILNASFLWKDIFIDKHSINGPADSEDAFSGTCMGLERSLKRPINLTITLPNKGDNDIHSSRFTIEHATLLSSIISLHAGRITSLCVQGSSHPHYLAALRTTFQLPMPLLRSATFIRDDGLLSPGPHPYYFYDLDEEPNPYPSILQCPYSQDATVVDEWGQKHYPALENLQIVGVPFDYSRFPARSLTELRLGGREWQKNGEDNVMQIVRLIRLASETLEILKIVDFSLDADYSDEDVIVLPKLRLLSLGYRKSDDVIYFLQYLVICGGAMTELTLTNTNVLASLLDAEVTHSQRQTILAEAESDDRFLIAELMASTFIIQLEKLTLNWVVFHGNPTEIAPSTILREEVKGLARGLQLEVDVDEYPNLLTGNFTASSKTLPIVLAFIRMLPSLKHLNVRDPTGTFLYFMNYPVDYHSSAPYVRFNLHTLETCRAHTSDWSLATAFRAYRQLLQPVPKMELEVLESLSASQDWPQFRRMANSGSQEELWDMTDEWSDIAAKLPRTFEEEELKEDEDEEGEDGD